MSHGMLLSVLGVVLVVLGIFKGGWFVIAAWLGCNFVVLGIAHGLRAHRVFGKRSDGTLPLWSRIVFLPFLLYTAAVWHIARLLSREPAQNVVADDIVIGRRLLPKEVAEDSANYIDLTAEFPEPSAIRRSAGYLCFPILDGSAPDPALLAKVVSRLSPGRTFIHCAQGHGRTALFTLALMLKRGTVQNLAQGFKTLKRVRPGINLTSAQRRCIDEFAANIRSRQGSRNKLHQNNE